MKFMADTKKTVSLSAALKSTKLAADSKGDQSWRGEVEMIPGKKKNVKNVLTRMAATAENGGPFSLLYRCVSERLKVKVWTRNYKHIRGICTGYLIAYDKHMNLAMMDVDEIYRNPVKEPKVYVKSKRIRQKKRTKMRPQLSDTSLLASTGDTDTVKTNLTSQDVNTTRASRIDFIQPTSSVLSEPAACKTRDVRDAVDDDEVEIKQLSQTMAEIQQALLELDSSATDESSRSHSPSSSRKTSTDNSYSPSRGRTRLTRHSSPNLQRENRSLRRSIVVAKDEHSLRNTVCDTKRSGTSQPKDHASADRGSRIDKNNRLHIRSDSDQTILRKHLTTGKCDKKDYSTERKSADNFQCDIRWRPSSDNERESDDDRRCRYASSRQRREQASVSANTDADTCRNRLTNDRLVIQDIAAHSGGAACNRMSKQDKDFFKDSTGAEECTEGDEGQYEILLTRHVNQCLVRGDNVVMVAIADNNNDYHINNIDVSS